LNAFLPTLAPQRTPTAEDAAAATRPGAWQLAAAGAAALALGLAATAAVAPQYAGPESALFAALASLFALSRAAAEHGRLLAARGWVDAATGMCNRHGLAALGEGLLQRARARRRPVSLLVLDFAELAEVRALYGRAAAEQVLLRVAGRVESIAGPRGLAARTGQAQFAVLLPGLSRAGAMERLNRILGNPGRIEVEVARDEVVLVPEVLAEMAAADLESVDELFCEMATQVALQRDFERRRHQWLRREGRRHSRPAPLAA
jgi:diguanylate cyclase (GGDEF)-like protein